MAQYTGTQVTKTGIDSLASLIQAECARRKYGSAPLDSYTTTPGATAGSVVTAAQGNKLIRPMKVAVPSLASAAKGGSLTLEALYTTYSDLHSKTGEQTSGASSGCNANCTGFCVSCTGTCSTSCSGCSGSCSGGCTSCSGCNWCWSCTATASSAPCGAGLNAKINARISDRVWRILNNEL